MKSVIFIIVCISSNLHAGLLDFVSINQARELYEQQQYQQAGDIFGTIENDFATLNKANSLYKQELYQQAINEYQTINNVALDFDKFYNLGNTYAKNGDIALAIKSYEDALSIKQDADAQFNLDLLQKQQQDNKENNKENTQRDNKNKEDEKSKNSKNDKNNKQERKNTKENNEEQQNKQNQAQQQQNTNPQQQLDDLQKRRLEKSLQKNIQTLMIPTGKQQNNYEKNPW